MEHGMDVRVIRAIDLKVLDGPLPINLCLAISRHEEDRPCVSRLKGEEKIKKDERIRVWTNGSSGI
jgi:hypothetical protein